MARSIERDESKDAGPPVGDPSYDASSTIAAHRWASAVSPTRAVTQPARTARGGYALIAESPSAAIHRWTVEICPAL